MSLSAQAQKIYQVISNTSKLGDLRNIAKEIKKDHSLAMELWSTAEFFPRLLSILIMDNKALDSIAVRKLFDDIEQQELSERLQLADWLMANQLMKNKNTVSMIESWEDNPSAILRRIYWYYQGRLRWVGQSPPQNTKSLLKSIAGKMANEEPEVQWAMNFTAGWIGVFDPTHRNDCIAIGDKIGLYKDEVVPRNCTPNFLPKFIEIEVKKRNLT